MTVQASMPCCSPSGSGSRPAWNAAVSLSFYGNEALVNDVTSAIDPDVLGANENKAGGSLPVSDPSMRLIH
jgi:hypothetical protein